MDEKELLIQYIESQHECEWLDFKERFYVIKHNKDAFIKDVVSFANSLQAKDKYIIFGVKDGNHGICGVLPDTIPDISTLENLLVEKVEPQITIVLGSFVIDNKLIAFLKIPYSNENRPYMIKNECGTVKQGDIYIRKGSINVKATRRDLDDIYTNQYQQYIIPYDEGIIIEPVYIKDSLVGEPTYGRIEIEVKNTSNLPLLINCGWIEFENVFGKIERSIYDILPNSNIRENPFEIPQNSHFVKTVLFEFTSTDCITLHFDEDGHLVTKTYVKTFFQDINGKIFESDPKEFFIIAKGDILHKVRYKYKEFRQYLKKKRKNILRAIELNQEADFKELMHVSCIDFSLILPKYVLHHPEFPEYDICAEMIQTAINVNNEYVIKLMKAYGLPQSFIELTLGYE
ncbi:ATP-binding protein [Clostridium intestinale]|uniref:ATP-binding protein n=1 Tax=Clostridium intestinale TaxID=36845 RepID=A0A7D6VX14_9CLOT|nr:ATP-binding protein [Clostridium intestinale]QLY81212.1 ATP-binding protein [Clostridium intestinale]